MEVGRSRAALSRCCRLSAAAALLLLGSLLPGSALPPRAACAAPDEPRPIWIFWNPAWEEPAEKALQAPLPLSGRALRRLRESGAPADARDLTNRPAPPRFLEHLAALGIRPRVVSRFLRAASVMITQEQWTRLREDPAVGRLQPVLTYLAPKPAPPEELSWSAPRRAAPGASGDSLPDPRSLTDADYGASLQQAAQIGVRSLHRLGYSGEGVLVCMLDGGFNLGHEAFRRARLVATRDFVGHDSIVGYDPADTHDPYNTPEIEVHGTMTWSALGGCGEGSLIGPAYRASFALARTEIVQTEIRAEEDNFVAGLEWADSLGAEVVSSSLGYTRFNDGFAYQPEDLDGRTAVTSRGAVWLARRGVVLVTAMGNDGPVLGTISTPADADSVVSVGAVDISGFIASFSSRGPTWDGRHKPDVCACGRSTFCAQASSSNAYGRASGTSLATPLVAGLVALLKEAYPRWSPAQVIAALHAAGDQTDRPDDSRGWGVPNGLLALGGPDVGLEVATAGWSDAAGSLPERLRDRIPSPGDQGLVEIVLRNAHEVAAAGGWATLVPLTGGLAAPTDSLRVPALAPGAETTLLPGFTLRLPEDFPAGTALDLSLRIKPAVGRAYEIPVTLPTQTAGFAAWLLPSPLTGSDLLYLNVRLPAPEPSWAWLYDARGRLLQTRLHGDVLRPREQVAWLLDPRLPSGVYWIRLKTASGSQVLRFLRIR